jgi:methylthioribose-1-phosphate isomerase
VTSLAGKQLAPVGVEAFNPAFDITPPSLVDAFITERGVFYQPFRQNALRLTECS